MKRDTELIRKILFAVEEADKQIEVLRIAGYSDAVVWHHVWLLEDAGLAHKVTTIHHLPKK